MSSYWTKKRRVSRLVRHTQKEILREYEETLQNQTENVHHSLNAEPMLTTAVSHTDTQQPSHTRQQSHSVSTLGEDVQSDSECEKGEHNFTDDSMADDDEVGLSCSSDSGSNDGECASGQDLLVRSLRYWATTYSVSLVALSALLSILRVFHPSLPKDGRTLLGTQSHVKTCTMQGGEYYHFGLEQGILSRLKRLCLPESLTSLTLQFNIDGLPLFKSSRLQFWPILALLQSDYTHSPFIVGIFCGLSKPKCVFEFLQQFVSDLKKILTNGIVHNSRRFRVVVSSFVCDAPARAYVKNIKSHNGYSGCDKCEQEGVWKKKMTYPETNIRLRTDASFNKMTDEEHHLGQRLSPLADILQMVSMFPIDYMHLCCLGVQRKLLNMWLKGSLNIRLSAQTVSKISSKLLEMKPHTPSEFNRKPRGLSELDRWKATELRSFMLYWGPVALKDSLPREMYDNFMLFSVGMYLFLSPNNSAQMVEFGHKVMVSFVNHFGQLYGKDEIVFSVHQLTHLAEEYRKFGPLDNVSGFPYENYLGKVKSLLRKPHQPLQQIVKRLSEMQHSEVPIPTEKNILQNSHSDGPLPQQLCGGLQYRKVSCGQFTLSSEHGDNCIVVGNEIALVRNLVQVKAEIYVIYSFFKHKVPFYTSPCESSNLGIYKVSQLSSDIGIGRLQCIKQKCVLYPQSDGLIAIPMVHMH